MRALMWFRADLRTADNTALSRATHEATRGVIGVFTICPEQWSEHDWAGVKVDLMLRTLSDLSVSLARLNIPLKILTVPRFADVPNALLAISERHTCDALYFNREYEINERRRDDEVARTFDESGRTTVACDDQVVLAPGDVLTNEGGWYTVFSPFKRKWMSVIGERGLALAPEPKRQETTGISFDPVPRTVDGFGSHIADGATFWPSGEKHALERLGAFIGERLDAYKSQRDIPSIDATSAISPYLTIGAISARQCVVAARDANEGKLDGGSPGAAHWISEVVWREFYKHILVGFPRVCTGRAFKTTTDSIQWNDDDEAFNAWCEARTGFPIIDAGINQLLQTGWMHNRVRMIVAMFLTKDLFIDWRRGERFFMQHLVDGDLASNNGGWQWSASTGTDAAPYFRIFNPTSQAKRCDPEGTYIRRYCPHLADLPTGALHDPERIDRGLFNAIDYPEPIVDHSAARERAIGAFKGL